MKIEAALDSLHNGGSSFVREDIGFLYMREERYNMELSMSKDKPNS